MENRCGLAINSCVVPATGAGERDAGASPIASLPARNVGVGGDKNYDTKGVVATLRALDVTPHIAQKVKSTRVAAGSCRLTFPASVSAAFECPAVPTS
jgi:hypothetical protein